MNPNNKNQLFRLSAVLYADSNYVVSAKTTLKKIVETALFTIEQASVSIHELIDFILDNYNFHIEEEEIVAKKIINSLLPVNPLYWHF